MAARRIALPFLGRAAVAGMFLALTASRALAAPAWKTDQATADADRAKGRCPDAVAAYERAIATAQRATEDAVTKDAILKMLTSEGNCLLLLNRASEAFAAYEKAALLAPNPATAYFDLCATYFGFPGRPIGPSVAACNRAIALDPGKADAYFMKGSLLVSQLQFVNGKFVVPAGMVEALNKYLELAPKGAHASDARQMLDELKQ